MRAQPWILGAGFTAMLACGDIDPEFPPYMPASGPTDSGPAVGPHHMTAAGGGGNSTATGSGSADETASSECPLGDEGCPCTPDGGCALALTCLSNICVDAGELCKVGTEGCPCTVGGTCDPMLTCLSNLCVNPGDG